MAGKTAASNPNVLHRGREENPVVFLEISTRGGLKLPMGGLTQPKLLGKLYIELRQDIAPACCVNFLSLVTGVKGYGKDGTPYRYKGTRLHRIIRDHLFQAGDLLNENGRCSKSIYEGGFFKDENFILRHTGPGVVSMCNMGPDTNGSLFQVTFTQNPDMDERYVVFGCLCADESFDVLRQINSYGSEWGEPLEEVLISDCGVAYPDPTFLSATK